MHYVTREVAKATKSDLENFRVENDLLHSQMTEFYVVENLEDAINAACETLHREFENNEYIITGGFVEADKVDAYNPYVHVFEKTETGWKFQILVDVDDEF